MYFVKGYALFMSWCLTSDTGTRTLVSCVKGKYANHLHHTGIQIMLCLDCESNTGPSDLQSDALPTELSRLVTLQQTHSHCFFNTTRPSHKTQCPVSWRGPASEPPTYYYQCALLLPYLGGISRQPEVKFSCFSL